MKCLNLNVEHSIDLSNNKTEYHSTQIRQLVINVCNPIYTINNSGTIVLSVGMIFVMIVQLINYKKQKFLNIDVIEITLLENTEEDLDLTILMFDVTNAINTVY